MLPMLMKKNGRSLDANRRNAAEASGGESNPVIYSWFKKLLLDLELKGSLLDFGAGKGILTQTILELDRFDYVTASDLMEIGRAHV